MGYGIKRDGRLIVFRKDYGTSSDLEYKVEKLKYKKLEVMHAAEDQKQ